MVAQGDRGLRDRGGRASNSGMSDETLLRPEFSDDACEECAPTERDPSTTHATPPRGVALSVLWWLETDEEQR